MSNAHLAVGEEGYPVADHTPQHSNNHLHAAPMTENEPSSNIFYDVPEPTNTNPVQPPPEAATGSIQHEASDERSSTNLENNIESQSHPASGKLKSGKLASEHGQSHHADEPANESTALLSHTSNNQNNNNGIQNGVKQSAPLPGAPSTTATMSPPMSPMGIQAVGVPAAAPQGNRRAVDKGAFDYFGRTGDTAWYFQQDAFNVERQQQARTLTSAGEEGRWNTEMHAVDSGARFADQTRALRIHERYSLPPLGSSDRGHVAPLGLEIDRRTAVSEAKVPTVYPQHVDRHAALYEARGGEFDERSTLVVHDHLLRAVDKLAVDMAVQPTVRRNYYNATAALADFLAHRTSVRAEAAKKHGVEVAKESRFSLSRLPFGRSKAPANDEELAMGATNSVEFAKPSETPDTIADLKARVDDLFKRRYELGLTEEHFSNNAIVNDECAEYVFRALDLARKVGRPVGEIAELDEGILFREMAAAEGLAAHPDLAKKHFSSRRRVARVLAGCDGSKAPSSLKAVGARVSEVDTGLADEFFLALARMRAESLTQQEVTDRLFTFSNRADLVAMAKATFGENTPRYQRTVLGVDAEHEALFLANMDAISLTKYVAIAKFFKSGFPMSTFRADGAFDGADFIKFHPFKAEGATGTVRPDAGSESAKPGYIVTLDLTTGSYLATAKNLHLIFDALTEGGDEVTNMLEGLILDGCEVTPLAVRSLRKLIRGAPRLRVLSLANTHFSSLVTATDFDDLAQALATLVHLECVDMSNMYVDEFRYLDDDITAKLLTAIDGSTATLQELWLAGAIPNQVLLQTAEGAHVDCALLRIGRYRKVSRTPCGPKTAVKMLQLLRACPRLASFNISFRQVSPEVMAAVAAAVLPFDRFVQVGVAGCRIEALYPQVAALPPGSKGPPLCCLKEKPGSAEDIVVNHEPADALVNDIFAFAERNARNTCQRARVSIVRAMLDRYMAAHKEVNEQNAKYVEMQEEKYDRLRRYAEELRFRKELELAQCGANVTALQISAGMPPARPTVAEINKAKEGGPSRFSQALANGKKYNALVNCWRHCVFRCPTPLQEPCLCPCCQ